MLLERLSSGMDPVGQARRLIWMASDNWLRRWRDRRWRRVPSRAAEAIFTGRSPGRVCLVWDFLANRSALPRNFRRPRPCALLPAVTEPAKIRPSKGAPASTIEARRARAGSFCFPPAKMVQQPLVEPAPGQSVALEIPRGAVAAGRPAQFTAPVLLDAAQQ